MAHSATGFTHLRWLQEGLGLRMVGRKGARKDLPLDLDVKRCLYKVNSLEHTIWDDSSVVPRFWKS